jgi:hypothetical protein
MARDTFADLIGRINADSAFRLALEADPWLALACRDLVRDGRQQQPVSLRASDIALEACPHDHLSQC